MTVRTDRRVAWSSRTLIRWGLALVGLLTVLTLAPHSALAQQQKLETLVDKATNHYDMLEIGEAEKKLEQAIELAKNQGVTGAPLAEAYVMLGVVRYGARKKKDAALSTFKKAVTEDPDASVPAVYQTPTLEKLMKQARASVDTSPTSSKQASKSDSSSARQVDEFTHEPIASAQAGESLTVEAFVPTSMSVAAVYVKFRRYDQSNWQRLDLEATDATRFAADVEGKRIYTSQLAYYLEAVDSSDQVVARSGSRQNPHTVTLLGSSDYEPPKARRESRGESSEQTGRGDEPADDGDERLADSETSQTDTAESAQRSGGGAGPVAYLDIGGGTAAGFLPGGEPTANPEHEVSAGLAPAFGHLRLGGGAFLSERASLGIYLRWQFSPGQDFAAIRDRNGSQGYTGFLDGECFGSGLSGDCMLGVKYRWFFTNDSNIGVYSSFGGGVGRTRHWLRLKERASTSFCENRPIYQESQGAEYCYRRDTVRPGWAHFGVGGGITYKFNDVFALMGEAYMHVLFPDAAVNLDINVGPQLRF